MPASLSDGAGTSPGPFDTVRRLKRILESVRMLTMRMRLTMRRFCAIGDSPSGGKPIALTHREVARLAPATEQHMGRARIIGGAGLIGSPLSDAFMLALLETSEGLRRDQPGEA